MDYLVKAIKAEEVIQLTVSAMNEAEAFSQVRSKGLVPLSAKQNKQIASWRGSRSFPLVLFVSELLVLIDSGLTIVEAIETLAIKERRKDAKAVLDDLLLTLYQGQTFSNALEKQSNVFPKIFIASVRASETTGEMSKALTRFISYEVQIQAVKKKIVNASIYPLLLLGVGSLVILFLLGFVVPKFSHIYEGTQGELPFLSALLFKLGSFIYDNTSTFMLLATFFISGLVFAVMQASFRTKIQQLFLKIPAFGRKLGVFQLARFYRTLGMLLKAGMPILNGLDTVSGLLDKNLQQKLSKAVTLINQGQLISDSFSQAGLTTPVAAKMLAVGERSGNIGEMMERIATFFDEELGRWIDWFTRLFEPILMLFIGLVIGVVVLLLYLPIFELAGGIE
jgi:general secretion pathway protein F